MNNILYWVAVCACVVLVGTLIALHSEIYEIKDILTNQYEICQGE